jgi:NADH-quinone oxidoreductase subunit L
MEIMIKLIVFLPLLSAVMIGLQTRSVSDRMSQVMTAGLLVVSAVLSGVVFAEVAFGTGAFTVQLAPWIASGEMKLNWAFRVDVLTAVMLVVVTWVSAVVHVYSVGYMSHDDHKPRFMAYLSLFTFCMLMLITADNFVQLFFGWEGVGLSSYLLIGFWFHKDSANAASMKAFLVNRVGDIGLAMGICLIYVSCGSVQFDEVFKAIPALVGKKTEFLGMEFSLVDLMAGLLFIGAMGKSAQFILHTWLPDAMEGPTPVSALIHAATMVTAGVFLLARCSGLFEYAHTTMLIVTFVGALTAFFAATVGMVQNDIKRVIAYSTCSQLGYMFFACGLGAYSAAVFHLMTHAFFKALLFLGAGSVIHAMSDEQDMRNMGGIWKKIPFTYAYMWIGSLALAGVFPFAGYYSKDLIVEVAYAGHGDVAKFAFVMGISAAFITAFYSWRLLFMTFHGTPRADDETMHHVHESPAIMLLPLVLLAGGAIFAGIIGHYGFSMTGADGAFWKGAIFTRPDNEILEHAHHVPSWVGYLPMGVGFVGIALAYICYIKVPSLPVKLSKAFSGFYQFFLNKWYFDELYQGVFVNNALRLGKFLWKFGDVKVVDGLGPNGLAWLSRRSGEATSKLETGYVYHYALAMVLGVLGIVSWFTYQMMGGL